MKRLILILLLISVPLLSQTRYQLHCNKQLVDYSRLLLIEQIGVTEATGHNDGEEVAGFLADIGLSEGNNWCAALQCSMYIRACITLRYSFDSIPFRITGLAVQVLNSFKKGTKTSYKVQDNDFIGWIDLNGINGHIEREIDKIDNDLIWTIGGNVNNAVWIKKRSITKKMGTKKVKGLGGFE